MFQAPLGGRQPPIHPQGPQQPQLDPQQNVQGLSNPQADRVWQQMQNQQMQPQFTAQLGQDFQQNPQILQDLLRRNLAQNQQIPQKPPMSQFTLQGQMGLPHTLNDSQPQQGFNPQQLQGGLTPQIQQALAARNQNMVSVLTQQNARQLDLLVATNQQNNQQSGQLNYPALRQQFPQQHQQQHQLSQMQFSQGPQMGQAPFFGDNPQTQVPNGVHQPQGNPQQQNQNQPRRPMTFQELRDRAQVVQTTIKDMEVQLQNARSKPEPEYAREANQLNALLVSRKQLLGKLIAGMQTMKQQGLERVPLEWVESLYHQPGPRLTPGAHSHNLAMQSVSPAPPQQSQIPLQQNPQWLQRTGPSPANGFMNAQQAGPSHLPARSPQVPQNQPAMQQIQQQNRPIMPPQIPPRQAPTPLQNSPRPPSMMANPQFAQQPGTATAAAAVGGNSVVPNPALLMQRPMQPLASNVFASAYAKWCASNGIQRDEALLSYEGRPIDLYQLHVIVMRAGGFQRVMQSDSWSVVGGQLGFSQLPGNGNEPPRCGPQMAQRLSQVYEKYLMNFDMAYIKSILQRAFKEAQQQQQQQQQSQQQQQPNPGQPQQMMHNAQNLQMGQAANGIPNNLQGPMGLQPSHAPQHSSAALNQAGAGAIAQNNLRTLASLTGVTDPARLNDLVQFSMYSPELLRAKGVEQNVINVVEVHRAFLQRTFQAQKSFREGVMNSQGAANPAAAAAGLMATQRQMAMAGDRVR
ncbi:hypothetical protein NLI96_g11747 [Meripilus lineatus]|uniref:ARID domain-containing protein n=1 Tax=Meripilus lineatus TaxID=2056292 RepID=A0AAD5YAK2_9APHY|nr:hypothetical protein NLI96_g11747 [Physisporinus lineatus]